MARKSARTVRTQALIDGFRGNDNEFAMLKGILCMAHGWSYPETQRLGVLIDSSLIAQRMDEINNEARARMLAELDAMRQGVQRA
ncbi:hypothetical protein OIV56_13390 [Burkholderia pseudomallei]|uniref:hypothetical protein n=1 Tax=Burkholderia pseudomallei TaxID=28450 RepID=UPI0021F7E3C6|nr:hypothetical protein [Burkholderia pseudomallei]MCW0163720.1 hypothetical protein [Burkholderia pseudomallei]